MPNAENNAVAVRLMTVPETASTLRLSRSSVYELIRGKQLEIVKIGRSTRVPAAAVDRLVEALSKANAAGLGG